MFVKYQTEKNIFACFLLCTPPLMLAKPLMNETPTPFCFTKQKIKVALIKWHGCTLHYLFEDGHSLFGVIY